jgi:hypothetical protein
MAEYTVKIDILYTSTVTVDADSEAEARQKAEDMARRDKLDKDFCTAGVMSVEIDPHEESDAVYFAAGHEE